jgi:MFS family permease
MKAVLIRFIMSSPISESSPLLEQDATRSRQPDRLLRLGQRLAEHTRRWKIVYIFGLFIFVIDLGGNLNAVPQLRLLELAVCRRYYLHHDESLVDSHGNVDEAHCKLDVVQQELAMLRGWLTLLQGIVQMVTVLPFGVLADLKGRKIVIALSQFSLFLFELWIVVVCKYPAF